MAKAAKSNTTPDFCAKDVPAATFNDAGIFQMGERLAELDRTMLESDAAWIRLGRLGRDSEAEEASDRSHEAGEEFSELEWKIIYTPAMTPEFSRRPALLSIPKMWPPSCGDWRMRRAAWV
jgi:hypothetical protein